MTRAQRSLSIPPINLWQRLFPPTPQTKASTGRPLVRGKATVSSNGLVSGVAIGSATITVTTADGDKSASCSVTVSAAVVSVSGVTLDKNSVSLPIAGASQLTATVSPSNATNQAVTWSTSDATKANVSASGLVTAASGGNCTITVTTVEGGKSAICAVAIYLTVSYSGNAIQEVSPQRTQINTHLVTR